MKLKELMERCAELEQVIQYDEDLRAQAWSNFDDEGEAMLQKCIDNNKGRLLEIKQSLEARV